MSHGINWQWGAYSLGGCSLFGVMAFLHTIIEQDAGVVIVIKMGLASMLFGTTALLSDFDIKAFSHKKGIMLVIFGVLTSWIEMMLFIIG